MKALLTILALVAATPTRSSLACGASEVCGDAGSSFAGHVIIDGIQLAWSSDSEPASPSVRYDIRRHLNGSSQMVNVAGIYGRGECDVNEDYTYKDSPPAPPSGYWWVYRIEVWSSLSGPDCAYEVTPPGQ